jgi:hypothetical protein
VLLLMNLLLHRFMSRILEELLYRDVQFKIVIMTLFDAFALGCVFTALVAAMAFIIKERKGV